MMEEIIEWGFRLLSVGKLVASVAGTAWRKFASKDGTRSSNEEDSVDWLLSLGSILRYRERILLNLYRCQDSTASVDDLCCRINYGDLTVFCGSVLSELHDEGLIRFDKEAGQVELLNTGHKYLEENVLRLREPRFYRPQRGST